MTERHALALTLPNKKYSLIYADPPWLYTNQLGDQAKWGAATSAYPTMKLEDICALPIASIAEDNCALILWSTGPKQVEAHQVIKAWGFRYVTIFYVWVKLNPNSFRPFDYSSLYKGRGQYTKPNTEIALLATRGYMLDVYDAFTVSQIILAPRSAHSEKPKQARIGIERLFGDVPRIELFARERVVGWDAWGNEV